MSRATLTDVAHAAGVSRATVSYALNHHRKISVATRERVCSLAESLGYRPDTTLARQMARIRLAERIREPETLALVWPEHTHVEIRLCHFSQSLRAGAHCRADALGYRLDEFHLQGETGLGVERLGALLKARGIRGVLLSPVLKQARAHLRLDWSSLAGVCIGLALTQPALHRVAHNHYEGMALCLCELRRQGFRRPALILSALTHERCHRAWVASFLAHHPACGEAGGLVRITRSQPVGSGAAAWVRRVRADVLIVEYSGFAAGLALQAVTLNWHPRHAQLSGVDQRYEAIASTAVDYLVGQLAHNILGLPELPVSISVPSVWRRAPDEVGSRPGG